MKHLKIWYKNSKKFFFREAAKKSFINGSSIIQLLKKKVVYTAYLGSSNLFCSICCTRKLGKSIWKEKGKVNFLLRLNTLTNLPHKTTTKRNLNNFWTENKISKRHLLFKSGKKTKYFRVLKLVETGKKKLFREIIWRRSRFCELFIFIRLLVRGLVSNKVLLIFFYFCCCFRMEQLMEMTNNIYGAGDFLPKEVILF